MNDTYWGTSTNDDNKRINKQMKIPLGLTDRSLNKSLS